MNDVDDLISRRAAIKALIRRAHEEFSLRDEYLGLIKGLSNRAGYYRKLATRPARTNTV